MMANRAPTAAADTSPRRAALSGSAAAPCRTGAGFYQPLSFNPASNDTDPDTATIDVANQLPLAVARVRLPAAGTNAGSSDVDQQHAQRRHGDDRRRRCDLCAAV